MVALLHKLWTDEDGQGLVEYGLIIAIVAIGVIAGLGLLTDSLDGIFQRIQQTLSAQ